MNTLRKQQQGVTLVETILVMVIGSALLYLSLAVYQSYRKYADVNQVQANAEAYFQTLNDVYRAKCFGSVTSTGVHQDTFISAPSTPFPNYYPLSLLRASSVQDTAFMPSVPTPNVPSIVDTTANSPFSGFYPQLNGYAVSRETCLALNTFNPYDCGNGELTGTVQTWELQVAVKLKDPSLAATYLGILAGDCLSSNSGGVVTPCATSGNTGDYVVWERPASSMVNGKAASSYWPSMPLVNQFNQMYQVSQINSLTDGSVGNQRYLCN